MKNSLPLILLIASLFIYSFAQAQTYYYAPNSLSFPILAGEWDANLRLGLARGATFDAREIMAAGSWKWAAAFVNVFDATEKNVKNRSVQGGSSYYWEGGVGVIRSTPKTTTALLAGYGIGHLFNVYPMARTAEFDIQKAFIQPTITYFDDYFVGAVGIRFSSLQYIRGLVDYAIDIEEIEIIKAIEEKSTFFLPEFGFQGGIRVSPFTLTITINTVFPNTGNISFARFNSNLSLTCRLNELLRK
jgi:hypothetical protein